MRGRWALTSAPHIRRTLIVQGDVRETLPRYLDQNPQTVIALAYFDLDLYEPTRDTLEAIRPYLTKGSVLAFDELAHAKWPGETAAPRCPWHQPQQPALAPRSGDTRPPAMGRLAEFSRRQRLQPAALRGWPG